MEVKNNVDGASWVSRTYNWDGPSNAQDSPPAGPECSRTTSPNGMLCNPKVLATDEIGYVGGSRTTFATLNNPYYPDF